MCSAKRSAIWQIYLQIVLTMQIELQNDLHFDPQTCADTANYRAEK